MTARNPNKITFLSLKDDAVQNNIFLRAARDSPIINYPSVIHKTLNGIPLLKRQ